MVAGLAATSARSVSAGFSSRRKFTTSSIGSRPPGIVLPSSTKLPAVPGSTSPTAARIVDLTGRVAQQTDIAPGVTQVTFDLTQLGTGVYVLYWTSGTNTSYKLFLVLK